MECKDKNPLQHDGTNQDQRYLKALEPGFAKVHELSIRDWMVFACNYAQRVNYFNTSDDISPDSDWKAFFKNENEIDDFLIELETRSDYEPHLALFLCFLRLMEFSQEQMNEFTSRHLNFYYEKILQLKTLPAIPEKVHVIFELAKNASLLTLPKNTALDAGKDKNSKPVTFQTTEEIAVNSATIGSLKSIYHNPSWYNPGKKNSNDLNKSIRYAPVTNSSDGLGTPFKKNESPSFSAFGSDEMVIANVGFALASPVLSLKEGDRTIMVTIQFDEQADIQLPENLVDYLQVYLTSEKGWLKTDITQIALLTGKEYQETPNELFFTVTVNSSQKAIVNYNAKIHGSNYTTNHPVMKVLLESSGDGGYDAARILSGAVVKSIWIDVLVQGLKNLILENDAGKIDPAKPFFPFTSLPTIGSGFYIGSEEIFGKNKLEINLAITWKGFPHEDMQEYYRNYFQEWPDGYDQTRPETVTGNNYFTVNLEVKKKGIIQTYDISHASGSSTHNTRSPGDCIPFLPDRSDHSKNFSINLVYGSNENISTESWYETNILSSSDKSYEKQIILQYLAGKPLAENFRLLEFDPGFSGKSGEGKIEPATIQENGITIRLNKDFLHQVFPAIYALAMKQEVPKLPNPPYTPVIQSITTNYRASEKVTFNSSLPRITLKQKLDDYAARRIQLFHEHPFGQAQQHQFLKDHFNFNTENRIYLLPAFNSEGELFIGLDKARPLSIVNILFQVAEGSENPNSRPFEENQRIQWHCLCNNEWKYLNENFLLGDTTQNFLRSGIVKILLPAEINTSNTILGEGKFWLRASLPEGIHPDAVCRFLDIKTQAVLAECSSGNDNSFDVFPQGSIKKIIPKPAFLRSLSQPFNSFGGRPAESGKEYFRRVSERLRHRQRAVNIWDYERIILQKFPSVYKVKCLNHTSGNCELDPGYVTVIVIPDTKDKNSYDPFQPRVSQNLLKEIEKYLNQLCSMHVVFDADNPEYETVKLDFEVKFYDEYDPSSTVIRLNRDIINYLSPWAYSLERNIPFGGKIYKSLVIRFIEELDYVDFVKRFKMFHKGDDKDEIICDSSRGILVSDPLHGIKPLTKENACI